MRLSRRDFLKIAGAAGITSVLPLDLIQKAMAGNGDPRVIWLQGQSCSGCSVSLLNSVKTTTIDDILLNKINLGYHSTLIAAAGDLAIKGALGPHPNLTELAAFENQWLMEGPDLKFDLDKDGRVNLIDFNALCKQGYILVVEGSIPAEDAACPVKFCDIGGHLSMEEAFSILSQKADRIIALGTCACYGGIPQAVPNPTGAKGVSDKLIELGYSKPLINIPGCPAHPDWFVLTLLKVLAGQTVTLDSKGRPADLFGDSSSQRVHAKCLFHPSRWPGSAPPQAATLGDYGCLESLGCKGKNTWSNCPVLKWNSGGPGQNGVNWCVEARSPCCGCVEPDFPDGKTPFITGS
ncbi:MAG: hypothetical protein WHS88_07810 [Anaerohalosphaeraceae bacterium]